MPPESPDERRKLKKRRRGERGLITALEWLSSCLTVLNDMVESGINDRTIAVSNSVHLIAGKLNAIGHQQLAGHRSLQDFVDRRFMRSIRTIQRTGERYRMLRTRITENAELVDAKLEAVQQDEQLRLLHVAESFAALGGVYYLGSTFTDAVAKLLCSYHILILQRCDMLSAAFFCGECPRRDPIGGDFPFARSDSLLEWPEAMRNRNQTAYH